MIIGILQCDSVKPKFRTQFENYPEMFQSLFKKIDPSLEFIVYDVEHGVYPENIDDCDAYITTGSKASVYDNEPWITSLEEFIILLNKQNKKLVAVCFGHQLVAQTLGGKTEKSGKGWGVGVHTIKMVEKQSWMNPALKTCNLIVSHQDQVIKLPDNALLIAGNPFCPNSMYQLGNNIFSLQGHPEFNKPYSETLMHFRTNVIGETKLKHGIESLTKDTDELTVARWIINFFYNR